MHIVIIRIWYDLWLLDSQEEHERKGLRTQARRALFKPGGTSVSSGIRISDATLITLAVLAAGSLQTQSKLMLWQIA
jgi:hypothetical protein